MGGKRFISIIFCILFTLVPVAFAKELTVLKISGQAGANGYYGLDDSTNITVRAALESDPGGIQADQLRLYINGERNEIFDRCAANGHLTECNYYRNFTPYPGEHEYEIRLYSDGNKFNENAPVEISKLVNFTTDIDPARIETFSATPQATGDGILTLTYHATDRALNIDDETTCSGVSKVEFILDAAPSAPLHTVLGERRCSEERSVPFTLSHYPNGTRLPDHVYTITPKAYDGLGQSSFGTPFAVKLDTGAPVITNDIRIVDLQGNELRYVSSIEGRTVDVRVRITDGNLATVRGDLRKLANTAGMQDRIAEIEGDIAIFRNIRLHDFSQCQITLTAMDTFGHSTTKAVDCLLRLDAEGPQLVELSTDRKDSTGNYLVGSETLVTAKISDALSGVTNQTVFLDMRAITGATSRPADTCTTTGTLYTCTWRVSPTLTSGAGTLALAPRSTDAAGNAFKSFTPTNIHIDTNTPKFGTPSVRVIGGTQGATVPVLTLGATFELFVPVTGHDTAQVSANLSSMGQGIIPMRCGETSCSLVTEALFSGPRRDTVEIVARNNAGNPTRLPYSIETFGLLNGTPNYWQPEVHCSPSLIDRQTASLIGQRMYCAVNLKNPNSAFYPVAVEFDGITSCEDAAGNIIDDISLLNNRGSVNPTFSLTLFENDYRVDSFNVRCNVSIFTGQRSGNLSSVNPNPEVEEIRLSAGFYNQPLGELYTNLDAQVKRAMADASENMAWVGKLEKFFNMASKFCNLKQTIANILNGLGTISYVVGHIRDISQASPAGGTLTRVAAGICGTETSLSTASSKVMGFLDKMCVFVECRAGQRTDPKTGKPIQGSGILNTLGAGSEICSSVTRFLGKVGDVQGIPQINAERKVTDYNSQFANNFDIKNSLILSSACLCLPGIIHNLQKMREIDCQTALCMKREVRDNGLPPSVCSDLEGYLTCNFVVGDIFSLFPIARLWSSITDLLANIISNPIELIRLYTGIKCRGFCKPTGASSAYKACILPTTLSRIGDAINSIKGIKNLKQGFDLSPQSGACDKLEDYE